MKSLLEWWDIVSNQEKNPQQEEPKAEVEVVVTKDTEEDKPEEEDKTIIKSLRAATVSNLITFTIHQGINKPDGDIDKLKEKLIKYIDALKKLVEEL